MSINTKKKKRRKGYSLRLYIQLKEPFLQNLRKQSESNFDIWSIVYKCDFLKYVPTPSILVQQF